MPKVVLRMCIAFSASAARCGLMPADSNAKTSPQKRWPRYSASTLRHVLPVHTNSTFTRRAEELTLRAPPTFSIARRMDAGTRRSKVSIAQEQSGLTAASRLGRDTARLSTVQAPNACSTVERCEYSTPLGMPVVPEV